MGCPSFCCLNFRPADLSLMGMNSHRLAFVLLFLLNAAALSAGDIPAAPLNITGMERGSWSLEPWGNSGSADKVVTPAQKLLKLIYTGETKDKSAFKHLTYFGIKPGGKVTLQVYSSEEKPPQVGIALSTTIAYRWHEAQPLDIKHGWNTLEFSVAGSNWKSEASNWEYKVPVAPIDDIRAIDIVIYNGKNTGVLYVQSLKYDLDERGEAIAKSAKQLQSEEVDDRVLAEKALVAAGRPAMEALYQLADDERPEVLLRAASALRQIEEAEEELPKDPKLRDELLKQKEEQRFDESRRRAEYTLHGLENERIKLLTILKDAQAEAAIGQGAIEQLKYVDVEKRKAYAETLQKLDATVKELQLLMIEKKKDPAAEKEKK